MFCKYFKLVNYVSFYRSTKVFLHFYSRLVKSLPMNDSRFIADLYSNYLLPGDLKFKIKGLLGSCADKASMFLDDVIEPSLETNIKLLNTLLEVMKEFGKTTNELAEEISSALNQISSDEIGIMYILLS